MNSEQSVNFQSLNVVRDELVATIESAARSLELFVDSKQEDLPSLQACIDGVQQILGILKVLELSGACVLATDLYKITTAISPGNQSRSFDRKMDAITNTFFILTRYLEFLQQSRRQVPVLLIPHINALRKLMNEPLMAESHFTHISVPARIDIPGLPKPRRADSNLKSNVRRIRHMYQIGLANVLRDRYLKNAFALMRRAMRRMVSLSSGKPLLKLFSLTDILIDALAAGQMNPSETRKFLFMRIESVLKKVEIAGDKAFATEPPSGLIKELIYLIILSEHKSTAALSVAGACPSIKLPYTELELQREYASLYGPSNHTVSSLAFVLQSEIANAKRTLENAAQTVSQRIDDLPNFVSALESIAEILSVVGLKSASGTLKEQLTIVRAWKEGNDQISLDEMDACANTLLYLESMISDLDTGDLQEGASHRGVDKHGRERQVASYELSSAIKIVIEEALGGISLSKRALNSYSDSNYDTGHIKNIAKTLNSIRGAMELMRHDRVASVLQGGVAFVEQVLNSQELPATIDEILETFADVIIAVEYYFDSANSDGDMDDSVLKVAEEALDALGYSDA